MGGLRIAGNIMIWIGIFFFLISALHDYRVLPFTVIGTCLFIGGMALALAGKGAKAKGKWRGPSQETEPSPYPTDEELDQYEYRVTCPHCKALILMKSTYTAQCPMCKKLFHAKK